MNKMKKNKGKQIGTFEREMKDNKFKADFDKEYQEFALEELLATMSQGDKKSVRMLAKAARLHPNAVQNLRSGKTNDIKLTSFLKIAKAHGFAIELVKGDLHIPIASKRSKPQLA